VSASLEHLAAQQEALLAVLFSRSAGSPTGPVSDSPAGFATDADTLPIATRIGLLPHAQTLRGLQAYQANGHALAERALNAAYPVTAALIGADSMAALARAFWHAHPPALGDLSQWGATLPGFLEASPSLADVPYLPDVARVDWAVHQAAGAPDASADLSSLARLTQEDPATLGLRLAPGTALVGSRYPVASLVQAHGVGRTDAPDPPDTPPDLAEAGRRLQAGMAEIACVWRADLRPRVTAIDVAETALLQSLMAGNSLLQAVDTACEACAAAGREHPFDVGLWLQRSVVEGRVLGVQTLSPAPLLPSDYKP
jgi:Putative DNA-binding domain